MNSTHDFILDSLKEEPIGKTVHFVWYITDIGIAALFKGNENFQAHTIKFLLDGHWRKDKNINFTVTFKMLEILTSAENPIPWLMFSKRNITGREESWQIVSHLSLSTDWRLVFNCWCIWQWFLLFFFLSKFPLFKISLLLA